jgi:hypothetical protein
MNHVINSIKKPSMVKALIRKDWYFTKQNLLSFFLLGLVSAALLSFENQVFYIGLVLLISVVILIGALLVFSTVINERKNQNLAFLMSLPITCMDYTKAKMILNLSAYFVAWLILVVATIGVIYFSQHIPNGLIPYALIILIELMVAFILVLGTALVTESEMWSTVIMTITNIGVSLFMFLIAGIKSINQHMESSVAVWNSMALMIIGIEIMIAGLIIGLTFYLQYRKKDFI